MPRDALNSRFALEPEAGEEPPALPSKRFFKEAEICQILKVCRSAIYKYKFGIPDPIPFLKVGRRYLYDLEKVCRWAQREAARVQRERQPQDS
jgi:hypothetical protein